jgi:hypothetical protein
MSSSDSEVESEGEIVLLDNVQTTPPAPLNNAGSTDKRPSTTTTTTDHFARPKPRPPPSSSTSHLLPRKSLRLTME